VERVTRIELAWPAWKYSTPLGGVGQIPIALTLSDRRWPLIAAKCGPTVAQRASHVRFLINRFPTLQTDSYGMSVSDVQRQIASTPALAEEGSFRWV
jgi:hypothetical protein